METIYVLIETESGQLERVLSEIRRFGGVVEASAVTGVYDIIVKVQTDDISRALSAVIREIKRVKGIKLAETLVGVHV